MARVLIGYSACPLTRRAFEAQGHDVWTCDLLPARDGAANHYQGDIWDIADGAWDFGLFHPMCTVLTTSGAWAFPDPDFKRWPGVGYHQRPKPETLVGAARRAQRVLELANFERLLRLPYLKAIENPAVSFINTAIRPPNQVIHPYHCGDNASKATGIWGDMPPIHHTRFVEPRLVCDAGHRFVYGQHKCPTCGSHKYLPRWANQTDAGQNKETPGPDRWLKRSETYPGIAAAWGDQWGRYLNTMTTTEHRQ
jgi:hypothetical protein